MSELLRVEDLSVFYGAIQALRGISFRVAPGEVVALIAYLQKLGKSVPVSSQTAARSP